MSTPHKSIDLRRVRRETVERTTTVLVLLALISLSVALTAQTQTASAAAPQPSFKVRFIEFGNAYLSIEPGSTLTKGMTLVVKRSRGGQQDFQGPVIAELRVKSVSTSSAICEVVSLEEDVKPGDVAYFTPQELIAISKQQQQNAINNALQSATSEQNNPSPAKIAVNAERPVVLGTPQPPSPISVATAPASTELNREPGPSSSQSATNTANSIASTTNSISAKIEPSTISVNTASSIAGIQGSNSDIGNAKTAASTPVGQAIPPVNSDATLPSSAPTAAAVSKTQPAFVVSEPKSRQSMSAGDVAMNVKASEDTRSQTTSTNSTPQQPKSEDHETQPAQEDAQRASTPNVQTIFKIKFVAQDVVYLSAGSATGLTAGMKLTVKHSETEVTEKGTLVKAAQTPSIAEIEVISVANTSAVCEVHNKTAEIQPGDIALMDEATAETLAEKQALSASRKYPQVVSFSEGDPLEEEVREEVPRPPLPEVDRLRGRIGFDYGSINSIGSVSSNDSQMGLVVRADFTRIGGTYWSLSGYWRGRLNSVSSSEQPTLQDLINRTYHLNLTYNSPTSPWVAGFGRLYLPWASSLDTIDGGYFGRKLGKHVLLGIFAGSTPDPTSWDYNPDRRIAGSFVNFEAGDFNSVRLSSTSGLALSTLLWQVDRPFIFFENGLYLKRYLSIYDSTQADDPRPMPGLTAPGPGLSRNFVTLRFQPHERISFDVDDNYFRDVPTFSTALIATGLLDKYLFQGLSAGARVEPIRHITLYTNVGKSSRTGDTSSSWNEMYGVTFAEIWRTGVRADVRASKFNSSFGNGKYRSVSLSRNFTDVLRLELQVGEQSLSSEFSSQTNSRFVNATIESNLGRNYFLQGAYTSERGGTFNYNQWTTTFGYRFDNRPPGVNK